MSSHSRAHSLQISHVWGCFTRFSSAKRGVEFFQGRHRCAAQIAEPGTMLLLMALLAEVLNTAISYEELRSEGQGAGPQHMVPCETGQSIKEKKKKKRSDFIKQTFISQGLLIGFAGDHGACFCILIGSFTWCD